MFKLVLNLNRICAKRSNLDCKTVYITHLRMWVEPGLKLD